MGILALNAAYKQSIDEKANELQEADDEEESQGALPKPAMKRITSENDTVIEHNYKVLNPASTTTSLDQNRLDAAERNPLTGVASNQTVQINSDEIKISQH